MAVAVYCRVSSEDQAERGTIEIQKDFAAKYVNLYGLDVFDYYCQCMRHQDGKNHTISRDSLQSLWAQLSESQKNVGTNKAILKLEL